MRRAAHRLRSLAGALGIAMLTVACALPNATPASQVATSEPSGSAPTSAATAVAPTPTTPLSSPTGLHPSPSPIRQPAPAGWTEVDPMPVALADPQAVKLSDGRVLVIGQRLDSDGWPAATLTLLWDPATGMWHRTAGRSPQRGGFALVALQDGRALTVGGGFDKALATTLAFDPATERWLELGRMQSARVAPAVAVLADGRVLAAGGHTAIEYEGSAPRTAPAVMLVAYRPAETTPRFGPPQADLIPTAKVRALASAELFDPSAGTWSATGAMRFPRSGAVAATLTDGQVLVVGSSISDVGFPVWPDERARDTAELFDAATARFTSVGTLPAISVPGMRRKLPLWTWPAGTLVAEPSGDALLVGRVISQYNTLGMTHSFRYEHADKAWSEVGEPWIQTQSDGLPVTRVARGPDIGGAAVVALDDGRVLVAGGGGVQSQLNSPVLAAARLYDPAKDRWTMLPRMPDRRTRGVGVLLDDGSVLLLGGYAKRYWSDPPPISTVVRIVPPR